MNSQSNNTNRIVNPPFTHRGGVKSFPPMPIIKTATVLFNACHKMAGRIEPVRQTTMPIPTPKRIGPMRLNGFK